MGLVSDAVARQSDSAVPPTERAAPESTDSLSDLYGHMNDEVEKYAQTESHRQSTRKSYDDDAVYHSVKTGVPLERPSGASAQPAEAPTRIADESATLADALDADPAPPSMPVAAEQPAHPPFDSMSMIDGEARRRFDSVMPAVGSMISCLATCVAVCCVLFIGLYGGWYVASNILDPNWDDLGAAASQSKADVARSTVERTAVLKRVEPENIKSAPRPFNDMFAGRPGKASILLRSPLAQAATPKATAAAAPPRADANQAGATHADQHGTQIYTQSVRLEGHPSLRLKGIVHGSGRSVALINDGVYRAGENIDGIKLLAIEANQVKLHADGRTVYLRLPDRAG